MSHNLPHKCCHAIAPMHALDASEMSTLNSSAIPHGIPEADVLNVLPQLSRPSHHSFCGNTGNIPKRFFVLILAVLGFGSAAAPQARDRPLEITEIAAGVFVHFGVNELMTAGNEGAIANIGFVIGDDAVA